MNAIHRPDLTASSHICHTWLSEHMAYETTKERGYDVSRRAFGAHLEVVPAAFVAGAESGAAPETAPLSVFMNFQTFDVSLASGSSDAPTGKVIPFRPRDPKPGSPALPPGYIGKLIPFRRTA